MLGLVGLEYLFVDYLLNLEEDVGYMIVKTFWGPGNKEIKGGFVHKIGIIISRVSHNAI